MSEELKVNRAPQGQPQAVVTESVASGSSKMPWIILGVVVLVIVVLGFLFRDKLFKTGGSKATATKSSGYQAVFLTNGQVYFGKLGQDTEDYLKLSDIYYLQVVQPPLQGQQTGDAAAAAAAQAAAQPQISLVKLGNELHGPIDEMHISKAQVLFYEDLKNDGNVVKAIDAYKANPTGAAVPAK